MTDRVVLQPREETQTFESIYPPPTRGCLDALGRMLTEVERWDRAVRTLAAAVEEADKRREEAEERYGC